MAERVVRRPFCNLTFLPTAKAISPVLASPLVKDVVFAATCQKMRSAAGRGVGLFWIIFAGVVELCWTGLGAVVLGQFWGSAA